MEAIGVSRGSVLGEVWCRREACYQACMGKNCERSSGGVRQEEEEKGAGENRLCQPQHQWQALEGRCQQEWQSGVERLHCGRQSHQCCYCW